jgi:4,5-DOPA dioxygenase extradiol
MTDATRDTATPPPAPDSLAPAPPRAPGHLPALYIGHGAPTLVDDPVWPVELAAWAGELPRPGAS